MAKFKVTLKANGRHYVAEGTSVVEAIRKIPVDALSLKTKSEISVEGNRKSAKLFMTLIKGRNIFRSHLRKLGLANQLIDLMK